MRRIPLICAAFLLVASGIAFAGDNPALKAAMGSGSRVLVYDSFTGTNADNLVTQHTKEKGAAWTARVADSVWSIDTNQGELTSFGTNPAANTLTRWLATDSGYSNVVITLDVRCNITLNAGQGIAFRAAADTGSGANVWAYMLYGDGTNCDEYVQKIVDGTASNVYSNTSGTMTNTTVYHLKIITRGNTIEVFRDGVKIGTTITDAALATNTKQGLFVVGVAGDKSFDNFKVVKK